MQYVKADLVEHGCSCPDLSIYHPIGGGNPPFHLQYIMQAAVHLDTCGPLICQSARIVAFLSH